MFVTRPDDDYGSFTYAGFDGLGFPEHEKEEPYIFHFPDGNASVARLLVRSLIPAAMPGSTMEDVVTAKADYCAVRSCRKQYAPAVEQHRRKRETPEFVGIKERCKNSASFLHARSENCSASPEENAFWLATTG